MEKAAEIANKSNNAVPSIEVSMSSDVYQPSSSNQSHPPLSRDSALAIPSTSVEYGSSVAPTQSVIASPSSDIISGSSKGFSTPIIRTAPSTLCSFEMLLLQRLNKMASTAAVVTSEEWTTAENKQKQETEEKDSRKRLKKTRRKREQETLEIHLAENDNEEVNRGELIRKEEIQIFQKKTEEKKKPKKLLLSLDSDSDISSEIDFANENSSDCYKEDLIEDMQREEQSDLEFEKTLENYNESEPIFNSSFKHYNIQ